jgi:hypothetical protein
MAKLGTVRAMTLNAKDIIEVPIAECEVVSVERVAGVLKDRSSFLIKIKAAPITGAWANIEGEFIVESKDEIPLVKKYTDKDARRARRRALINSIWNKLFGPKVEEVKQIAFAQTQTGPMT